MKQYDVIVIGGGASGLMAAYTAAKNHNSVLLIERNESLGKKLLITGGGRCNLTNNKPIDKLIEYIPGNGRFLYSSFHQFSPNEIMQFFTDQNVKLKEEDHGRIFPVSNKSQTILHTFEQGFQKYNVTVQTNTRAINFIHDETTIQAIQTNNGTFYAKHFILTTGGASFPQTGSSGDGYTLAKQVGHTITTLYPSEVPFTSKEDFIKRGTLQGLSMQNVELSMLNKKGKVVKKQTHDILFTHFGISGPAALRLSSHYYDQVKKDKDNIITLLLNALPTYSKQTLKEELYKRKKVAPSKEIKTHLKSFLQERYVEFLLTNIQIDPKTPINQLNEPQMDAIATSVTNFKFTVSGTLPLEQGFVTKGGISIKEVDPKTMKSKHINNLSFAGEVLDLSGYTGGYNLTIAFSTGFVAANNL